MAIEDRPFSQEEQLLLKKLELAIDRAVARVCDTHLGRGSRDGEEEPPISARIAQAIESELEHNPIEVDGMKVEVATHIARSATQETITGVDLLISTVRYDRGVPTSKSAIAQSKLETRLDDDHRRLRNQANRMRTRSKSASYVMVIGKDGAQIAPAERACYPKLPGDFPSETITFGELVTGCLRCTHGDKNIGRNPNLPVQEGLDDLMHRLKAWRSISFAMTTTSRKRYTDASA